MPNHPHSRAPRVTVSDFRDDPEDPYIAVNLRVGRIDVDLDPEEALRLAVELTEAATGVAALLPR